MIPREEILKQINWWGSVIWEELPEDIRGLAIQWGTSDTVFRDNLYEYLKNNKFSVYINFENFLDARQTRFDYTGTLTNPVFRDIYAPLDGFLINGGIKLKL